MDTNTHLKLVVQCLISIGFWPKEFESKISRFFYEIYYFVTMSVFAIFLLSQFVEMYLVMGKSLEELSGLMAINFLYTLGLIKIWVVGTPTIKRLVKKIQITEKNIKDENTKKIFMKHVAKTYLSNRLMIVLGTACCFMFILAPLFEELANPLPSYTQMVDNNTLIYLPRPLPLVSWFPFDRYKYYYISFSWHAIAASYSTAYIVGCNNMFFALMIFAIGQIKILQQYILTLTKPTSKASYLTFDEIVADNLTKIIIYHNSIIRFVEELNNAMKFFLLVDFAACVLQLAMIGFEIVVAELSFQLLKNIIYIGSMLTQLFLFYWLGNEVLLESAAVANAVWQSPWYECNNSARKTLLQIMMRSQRPLKLSVGMFYYMSTETMLTILKSSYSYTALMHQLYSRKPND